MYFLNLPHINMALEYQHIGEISSEILHNVSIAEDSLFAKFRIVHWDRNNLLLIDNHV